MVSNMVANDNVIAAEFTTENLDQGENDTEHIHKQGLNVNVINNISKSPHMVTNEKINVNNDVNTPLAKIIKNTKKITQGEKTI